MGDTTSYQPRRLRWVALGTVVVVGLAVAGAATYFADQLTALPTVRPFEPDNEVLAVDGDTVTLRDEGWAALPTRWGLQLPGGDHAELLELVERSEQGVVWRFGALTGDAPAVGDPVRVDEFVHVGTPEDLGLPFRETTVNGPEGPLPTWDVGPAQGVGTVVFVHGRGATREEALRFLPALVDAGWRVVVPSYRGDGTGPDGDGRVRYGVTEWRDLDAVVKRELTTLEERPLVVFGVSMGGAIALQLRDRSAVGDEVDGLVLDSPVLSMDALLDLQAGLNGVPPWAEPVLLPVVERVADTFLGLETDTLEQVADDGTVNLPVLLFHGTGDDFVPVGPSAALANLSDDVEWVHVAVAGHVRSWNIDPAAYDAALTSFLAGL